jgi:hypothetical protein
MGRALAPELIILIVAVAAFLVWRYIGWAKGRMLERARWHAATRSLPTGDTAVVIEREGETAQTVKVLSSGMPSEEFSDELATAMSEAQAKAAALNAARSWR